MYAIEDFGCEIDYSDIAKGGVAKVTKTPIHEVKDWHELKPCSVKEGSLARELKGLKLILDKVKNEDVPVIFTIFSPLTTANKLSGNTLLQYLKMQTGMSSSCAESDYGDDLQYGSGSAGSRCGRNLCGAEQYL